MTLATIEAAAIDCERWSPLTTAWPSQVRPGGTSSPSASASRGFSARPQSGAPHRLEAGLADVGAVDGLGRAGGERDGQRLLQDDLEQLFALVVR